MRLVHAALFLVSVALGVAAVACDSDASRMQVVTTHARAGESIVVRFDTPPVAPRGRGDVWLTLVPAGASDEFVGEHVVLGEGVAEATIPAGDEGAFELRLVDESPRRLARVVSRARVEVGRASLARNEAPAWYG